MARPSKYEEGTELVAARLPKYQVAFAKERDGVTSALIKAMDDYIRKVRKHEQQKIKAHAGGDKTA